MSHSATVYDILPTIPSIKDKPRCWHVEALNKGQSYTMVAWTADQIHKLKEQLRTRFGIGVVIRVRYARDLSDELYHHHARMGYYKEIADNSVKESK
jgi:hypothetical protein